VKLSDLQGSIVLVNFWIASCGACRGEIPQLQSFYDQWKDKGATVLAINVYGKQKSVEIYVMAQDISFPVLLDYDGKVAESYKLEFLPTTFFVDRQGIIRYIVDDPFKKPEDIEKIIEEMEHP
jgi:peroxiredoxin